MRETGHGLIASVLSREEIEFFRSAVLSLGENLHGVRRLFERLPPLLELAKSKRIATLVQPLIGDQAIPVRALFFDRNSAANWKVPWHQDLSIAVAERREVMGYGPWSLKDGELHVQPPVSLLQTISAVRIHLDDCGESNGPLRVVPGSHNLGRIPEKAIRETVNRLGEVVCTAQTGDAIVMSPLLLHASSVAAAPSHRRVIHLEYCSGELAGGLEWAVGRDLTAPVR